jgi:hypothetical protein
VHGISSQRGAIELHILSLDEREVRVASLKLDVPGQFEDREVDVPGGIGAAVWKNEAATHVSVHVERSLVINNAAVADVEAAAPVLEGICPQARVQFDGVDRTPR